MRRTLSIILISTLILIIITYIIGGSNLVIEGFNISMNTLTKSALMLLVSFIVTGQIHVLITKDMVEKWLKKYNGIKGIIISSIAGGLFPVGSFIYYPFVQSFRDKGLPLYILISFLFGKFVYDFVRIPMEVSLINFNIAFIRNLLTIPIPIVVGLLSQRLYNNRTIENIFLKEGEENDSKHPYS